MKNEIELRQKSSEGICSAVLSFRFVEENCRLFSFSLRKVFGRGRGGCASIKKLLRIHRNMQSGSPFFSLSIAGTKKKRRKTQRKQGYIWVFNETAPLRIYAHSLFHPLSRRTKKNAAAANAEKHLPTRRGFWSAWGPLAVDGIVIVCVAVVRRKKQK